MASDTLTLLFNAPFGCGLTGTIGIGGVGGLGKNCSDAAVCTTLVTAVLLAVDVDTDSGGGGGAVGAAGIFLTGGGGGVGDGAVETGDATCGELMSTCGLAWLWAWDGGGGATGTRGAGGRVRGGGGGGGGGGTMGATDGDVFGATLLTTPPKPAV